MDVGAWLRGLGLERYEGAFRDSAIDAEVLPDLTEADLEQLGVVLGHRKRLLRAIAELREPLAEQAAATPTPPARERTAERRQLTVMFADLVGSTALAVQLDPEDLREVIAAYHRCVAEVIRRFEGHIAKFLGDGVLAYFGYPRAHEDDAERAVRAGLDLVEAVGGLAPQENRTLRVRVGIATGLVVVGDLIGEGAAREEAVVGETPNLAARLQGLAEPGSVVISRRTRRLVGGLFDLADLGAHALRGFTEPVPAWRVLGPSRVEGRFEARQAAGLTPLIGREEELALLLRRWALAKEGEGQVVLLGGEAGIGKSRLLRALRERLDQEPYTPLSHFCSPYHVNSVLHPVIRLLERAAGLKRDDPPEQQLDKLEALLALSTADVREVAPLVADLLSIPTGERYPPLDLTPQRRKEKLLAALLAQLEGLAAKRPVLEVFEDVHWVDPSTLELLGLVVERAQRLPVLAVITFRPEFTPPWTGYGHVTSLTVTRLGRRQVASMAERVTGGRTLPAEVVAQIVAKTDGVPLFVEELTKAVLESGLLHDQGDRYALAGPLAPLAIPATLQDSLMARLDRLAPVKEIAQVAAVIGREFSHELLAAATPLPADELREGLDDLIRAELIFRRGMPPEAVYSFKHALVRDAAYASLLKSRRRQLHARVAHALQERFADKVNQQPELLAYHLTEAELVEEAIPYWRRAGERASERSANSEAIAHLSRGLQLVGTVPDGPPRLEDELALQVAIAGPLIATKGYSAPEVERTYSRASALCNQLDRTAELFPASRGLWNCYLVRGQLRTALGLAERLVSLVKETKAPVYGALARRALGSTLFFLGRPAEAAAQLDQGIALDDALEGSEGYQSHVVLHAERAGVVCRLYSAYALWFLGFPDRALARVEAGLALGQRISHPHSMAFALNFAAVVHNFRREFVAALKRAEAAIDLASEHRLPQWLAMGTMSKGLALSGLGEHAEGIAQLRAGLAGWGQIGARLSDTQWLGFMAAAYAHAGRLDDALAALERAAEAAEETAESYYQAELFRLRGAFLIELGKPSEAERWLNSAIDAARNQGAKSLELRATTTLARLRRQQDRRGEARDLLAPIYGWFTEGFETPDLKDAKFLLHDLR